jgi:cytochrome c
MRSRSAVILLATAAIMLSLGASPARSASTGTSVPSTAVSGADDLWHHQPVVLTFTASDPGGPGIASTEYSLDAGTSWAQGGSVTIAAPADHAGDGLHTVLYRSVDSAGNSEAAQSVTVMIDTAAPTTTISGRPSGWVNQPVTLSLDGADALSGVAHSQYRLDGAESVKRNETVALRI